MTATEELSSVGPDLEGITDAWQRWPEWHQRAIVRRQGRRWILVAPTRRYYWAIYIGPMSVPGMFSDVWLYTDLYRAYQGATHWTGAEPTGWFRHPRTGRQRPIWLEPA